MDVVVLGVQTARFHLTSAGYNKYFSGKDVSIINDIDSLTKICLKGDIVHIEGII